jgi:hypothetical protein
MKKKIIVAVIFFVLIIASVLDGARCFNDNWGYLIGCASWFFILWVVNNLK